VQALKITMNCSAGGKIAGTAFPRFPAQLHHCMMLTNLWPTCPMSEEPKCDERDKWKFDKFGTLNYKSKK